MPSASAVHDEVLGDSDVDIDDWDGVDEGCHVLLGHLLARAEGCEREVAVQQAWQVRALAEMVAVQLGEDVGDAAAALEVIEAVAAEVAPALRVTATAAQQRVADAVWITTALPSTLAALESGRIDYRRARVVAEETVLCTPEDAAAVDAAVAGPGGPAPGLTGAQLRPRVAAAVARVDPTAVRRRAAQAVRERRVAFTPLPDGQAQLTAVGPAVAVRQVYERLTSMGLDRGWPGAQVDPWAAEPDGATGAAAAPEQPDQPEQPARPTRAAGSSQPDRRSLDARRFDALCQLAALPLPEAPGLGAVGGPHVVAALSTVLGRDDEPGELAGYGPVPAAQVRHAAQRGRLRRALVAADTGELLALDGRTHPPEVLESAVRRERLLSDPFTVEHGAVGGHAATSGHPVPTEQAPPEGDGCPVAGAGGGPYRPGLAVARLVRLRGRTCSAPGCRTPAARCDLDHVVPHPAGPTCPCNLTPLCRRHHRMKHCSGWSLRRDVSGTLLWTSPLGRSYEVRPPPLTPEPP